MIFIIDGVKFESTDHSISDGEKAKILKFDFNVIGEKEFRLTTEFLKSKKIFNLEIPEKEIQLDVKKTNYMSSYKDPLNENTIIDFSVELTEVDINEDPEWNSLMGIYQSTIMNWIRTRAISELLVDKGIITSEEYLEKIDEIVERDWEELSNVIRYGQQEKDGEANEDEAP